MSHPLSKSTGPHWSPTSFGVRNPVPANLLMLAIIAAGLIFGSNLRREFFPEIRADRAMIVAPYPGASPKEIEEGLILKIEDEVADIESVEEISATVTEGVGSVMIKFRRNIEDINDEVTEVKSAIDTLTDLPAEAERIRTTKFETTLPVISLALFGDAGEAKMKRAIRELRDDIKSLPDMGNVEISGFRTDEIRVEVPADMLLRYGLSLPEVSERVRAWMQEIPGGTVRNPVETVRLRTMGVEEAAEAIRDIVVRSTPEGSIIRLGDIATVTETFEDIDLQQRFNGKPAVSLTVLNEGDRDTVKLAEMVRAYAAGRQGKPFEPGAIDRLHAVVNNLILASSGYSQRLEEWETAVAAGEADDLMRPLEPRLLKTNRRIAWELGASKVTPLPGQIMLYSDLARFIEGRLDLLTRNAIQGAVLVFLTLLLFLNFRIAFWVMVGLLTSLLGTLAFMYFIDTTLNLLTMFGLIIVLGLLVDDAIVVAENIVARHEAGEPALAAAMNGGNQIAWPVVATVTTTVAAFWPLRMIEGEIGDFLGALPIVVICALSVSLLEALIILPSHVAHSIDASERRQPGRIGRAIKRFEQRRDHVIYQRIVPIFGRFVAMALHYRYIFTAFAIGLWIVSIGLVAGGQAKFTFFPSTDSETFIVDLNMPVGTSFEKTSSVLQQIEEATVAQPEVQSVQALVGQRLDTNDWSASGAQSHLGQLIVELVPVEERERTSFEITDAIRNTLPPLVGISSLRFEAVQGGPGGQAINIAVSTDDENLAFDLADLIKQRLSTYEGVYDIADDGDAGQREVQVVIRPEAAPLGLTPAFVAQQVRGFLYGLEPHTFAEDEEDVDVRVMLDEASRSSLAGIEQMYIFTPSGERVPLAEVAELTEETGYATIRRLDRERTVTVTADVNQSLNNPESIIAELAPYFSELERENPGVSIEPRGRALEMAKSMAGLQVGFLVAMGLIYVILAWLFGNYFQPLAVMLAIPFSMIGVIWGHMLLGFDIMILSLIGFVALTGIVVNDSLILIEFYNHKRREGLGVRDALIESSMRRLRPITLTTLTTVLGLMPLMLEQSFQARFLIPMGISIACGLISATVLILVVLPCLIEIGYDVRGLLHFLWTGRTLGKDANRDELRRMSEAEEQAVIDGSV